jgi:antitoxin component YwqK of YwqJK toxin-antitoxin module
MKNFYLILTLFILMLPCCKPIELKQFDQLGYKAVVHTDTSTMNLELYDGHNSSKKDLNSTYYWFEHGKINSAQGYYSGKLLHGEFVEQDRATKKPITSGSFSKGTKTGRWMSWKKDGSIKEVKFFKKGKLNGPLVKYDSNGYPVDTIKYKGGKLVPGKLKPVDSAHLTMLGKIKKLFKFKTK